MGLMVELLRIGEAAFYKLVGGPDAMISREAGASVILRLLAIQSREALRVNPTRLDRSTAGIIKSVDAFYGIKGVKNFPSSAAPELEAHPAKQLFEVSGLPQEMLLKTQQELDKALEPLQKMGFFGKLLERVIREQRAARLTKTVVSTKTDIIFNFGGARDISKKNAGDPYIESVFQKHGLEIDAALEQIEPKAIELLSDQNTLIDGAQLVLHRRVDARDKEIMSLLMIPGASGKERFALLLMRQGVDQAKQSK